MIAAKAKKTTKSSQAARSSSAKKAQIDECGRNWFWAIARSL